MSDFKGIRAQPTAKKARRGQGIRLYDWRAPSPGHWNPHTWWLSREGWRWTWHTISRLFRYRQLRDLWSR